MGYFLPPSRECNNQAIRPRHERGADCFSYAQNYPQELRETPTGLIWNQIVVIKSSCSTLTRW